MSTDTVRGNDNATTSKTPNTPAPSDLDPRLRDPERADWTMKDRARAGRREIVLAIVFISVEVVLIAEMFKKIIETMLGAKADTMQAVIIAIGVVAGTAISLAGYLTARKGGSLSRLEGPRSRQQLWVVGGLGVGLALMRVAHLMQGVRAVSGKGQQSTTAAQAAATSQWMSVILAVALLLLYVVMANHAWSVGRDLDNPALLGMVHAQARESVLRERVAKEAGMLDALRRDAGNTQHQIDQLPTERQIAMREVHAMVAQASHLARLRLVELLGRPEASSLVRTPIEFSPLMDGVEHTPPTPSYGPSAPPSTGRVDAAGTSGSEPDRNDSPARAHAA